MWSRLSEMLFSNSNKWHLVDYETYFDWFLLVTV